LQTVGEQHIQKLSFRFLKTCYRNKVAR